MDASDVNGASTHAEENNVTTMLLTCGARALSRHQARALPEAPEPSTATKTSFGPWGVRVSREREQEEGVWG